MSEWVQEGILVSSTDPRWEEREEATLSNVDFLLNELETVYGSKEITYRNEEFGFEIQYPKAFEKVEQCALREGLENPNREKLLHLGNSIDVIIKDGQNLDFEEFVAEEFGSTKGGTYEDVLLGTELEIKEFLVVGNEKAVRVAFRGCHTCRYGETTHILHNGKLYELGYFTRPSCVELDFEQFEYFELTVLHQILSKFRFIKIDNEPINSEVPPGYNPEIIQVKFNVGVDLSNPETLLTPDLQSSVEGLQPLFTAPTDDVLKRWFRITLKKSTDSVQFMTNLQNLSTVETAEFASLPAPPP